MKNFCRIITSVLITATASISLLPNEKAFGVGLTTTQGDIAIRSDIARERFGVTGKGVLIGVISDSYNNLGFSQLDVDSGDLPEGIRVIRDIDGPPGTGTDEGNALMQIMYDIAPSANFIFHTGLVESQAEYAKAIEKLADAGARIIISDVNVLRQPMFQDGLIAQAVDRVVSRPSNGVSFFASAGNAARQSYQSPFNSSGVIDLISGGELHDFDPGPGVDTFQRITMPTGSLFSFSLQWDSPFFSVSGGAGSPNDLDIFLYDSSGTELLASSTESNIGNDPLEFFDFINETQSTEFNLAIALKDGPAPNLLKYVTQGLDFEINEFNTSSSTIYGFANARGALPVGAAFYLDTPEFGVEPPVIQLFSSAGGTPILFDANGNRLANPEIRKKPGIVAPDGVNNTFFGFREVEGDEFPNVFGTSVVAPHAAAVAALLLEFNPNLSPAEIYDILQRSAIDMDDPSTPEFDIGFDFGTGYGLIQADRALSLAAQRVPEPSSVLALFLCSALGIAFVRRCRIN
ncbi:S8 family peptidase [Iningainema tapete]|uniref:S8 family serine peptidase n=1 Tax=Iningainema tapete BLCC-T55 TaxID=2748662 RepID=A0A8J6XUG6_9CYAN|nr:S8 family serine peptidase [Iningainema tapete]MBD2774058.1 S8 family serine peptidase [Iningainema tapete BLCC-T55]